jgi:hypothetical protein
MFWPFGVFAAIQFWYVVPKKLANLLKTERKIHKKKKYRRKLRK